MKYRVYPQCVISTVREVEADSVEDAITLVLDNLGSVMFLDHGYQDMGEWTVEDDDVEELS